VGFDGHLIKPVDFAALERALAGYGGKHRSMRSVFRDHGSAYEGAIVASA
jgi:response regulator of citrate/malate metabolism